MAKDYTPSNRNREAFEALTEGAGNVPPQAVELEEAVLGALMLEKDSIITVQEFITPEAFYTEEHRLIYKAIEELSMELKPIDLYTVTERLKAKKELKKVGGAAYLAQLTQKVGSAANVEFHAKIIAQKYVQRELIRSATEIQRRSYDESTDVTELIGFAEGEIFKVSEGHVKRSVQSSKDILARALIQIEEASKNTSAYNGVPSGFMAIDRVTLGWQLSDLIIVAARPSMGKTAFVLSMARNMAVDYEQGVAFFSLEMSAVQLMMRLIIAETGLNGNDVKSGRLTPEQWRHLESATKPLGSAPLYIDDTPALSVFEFRSKARRLKIHNDIKIIIIDYLQLMTGNQDTKGNREQEVAFISRTLKAIAKELNVPIIVLSLLCRANGHFRCFNSVGQHCLACCDEACARGLSREVRLACLLHDASEAFISDITRPVKHNLPEYLVIEKRLQDTIYRRFGIDPEDAEVMRNVSAIDDAMLYHEFLALSGYPLYDSVPEIASQPVFGFRPFEETEKSYLEILYKLTEDK